MKFAFDSRKVREAVRAAGNSAAFMQDIRELGISFDARLGAVQVLDRPASDYRFKLNPDGSFACDAQPELVTVSNAGIPSYLTNYFDPDAIRVLVTPMKAAQILGGEVRKGDWTVNEATFVSVEAVGETAAYGDWGTSGKATANLNFPTRQSFLFSTFAEWGERQLDLAGLARVNFANEVQSAANLALAKFQNKSYFYGVAGLKLYGLLNDPSLPAPITATAAWGAAATTGDAIYEDIRRLYAKLVAQSYGIVDASTEMVLSMSPFAEATLHKTNQYNVNVYDQIRKNFPGLRIESAPEYDTPSGSLVQLIALNVEGHRTAEVAFNEKMRAHAVVVGHSSWSQKRTAGTFGTIIYRPFLVASMTGV